MELLQFFSSENFDLVAVGIAIAAIIITAIGILIADRKSVTNQTFFLFALSITGYTVFNYLGYRIADTLLTLWFLRLSIFFATWASLLLFHFFLVFPNREAHLSVLYRRFVVPCTAIVAFLTLTPLVFSGIQQLPVNGQSPIGAPAPGLAIFGITSAFLVIAAMALLIRKTVRAAGTTRKQFAVIAFGAVITFSAILVFNVGLPLLLQNTHYILLAPVFFFPFLGFTAYAILHYKLFNIKVAAVSLLSFVLSVTIIMRVIFSQGTSDLLFGISQFILVIIFSGWLIQSIRKEIDQREHIEFLAENLKQANEKLKELDQLKSEFLSIASHQLRAPLTAIRGYSSLILEGDYGQAPEPMKDPLSRIAESSRAMVNSIEDYLNISRIEQGRMKYEASQFDLADLVKKVVDELTPVARSKNLNLVFAPPIGGVSVNADVGKIKQVITNLVDNAIKYTDKGSVTVATERAGDRARLTVSDTGVGIPTEELGGLFEKFTRARGANKINTTGTGLGLYVAKQLVEGHKGTIRAESEGPGKGSRFVVELPAQS